MHVCMMIYEFDNIWYISTVTGPVCLIWMDGWMKWMNWSLFDLFILTLTISWLLACDPDPPLLQASPRTNVWINVIKIVNTIFRPHGVTTIIATRISKHGEQNCGCDYPTISSIRQVKYSTPACRIYILICHQPNKIHTQTLHTWHLGAPAWHCRVGWVTWTAEVGTSGYQPSRQCLGSSISCKYSMVSSVQVFGCLICEASALVLSKSAPVKITGLDLSQRSPSHCDYHAYLCISLYVYTGYMFHNRRLTSLHF